VSESNLVVANVYGRGPDGSALPLAVSAAGGLGAAPVVTKAWTVVAGVNVLTPLVAFAAFGDDTAALIFGMRCEADAADGATFLIEMSEDGVNVAKSFAVQYLLIAGEHDVYVVNPVLLRYARLSVQPSSGGVTKVGYALRRIPR
jgi:hypothetical protein